jgi:hypothetical protein
MPFFLKKNPPLCWLSRWTHKRKRERERQPPHVSILYRPRLPFRGTRRSIHHHQTWRWQRGVGVETASPGRGGSGRFHHRGPLARENFLAWPWPGQPAPRTHPPRASLSFAFPVCPLAPLPGLGRARTRTDVLARAQRSATRPQPCDALVGSPNRPPAGTCGVCDRVRGGWVGRGREPPSSLSISPSHGRARTVPLASFTGTHHKLSRAYISS